MPEEAPMHLGSTENDNVLDRGVRRKLKMKNYHVAPRDAISRPLCNSHATGCDSAKTLVLDGAATQC
jgi:hypothetical protein